MRSDNESSIPSPAVAWKDPWYQIEDAAHQLGVQRELEREIGPLHPLWQTNATAFGVRGDCDDVAVVLSDGRFAIVHLVWHGHIDAIPDVYPFTRLIADLAEFQAAVDDDAADWAQRG